MGMPTYTNGELILPGHWVKVWTPRWGGIWHHGIVHRVINSGDGSFYIEIIHNVKNRGVIVSSLEEFSRGGLAFFVRRPTSPEHGQIILATADANLEKPYSAFSQNCEHFCWFCYTWEPKSETVQAFAALTAAGVLALVAFGSDSK
jgi:hypothetical protein